MPDVLGSILYKTRLPFILVFNKTDIQPHNFALEWMEDFEAFQEALADRQRRDADGEQTYMSSLMNSMCLVLDEFYKGLKVGIRFCGPALLSNALLLDCGRICCDGGWHCRFPCGSRGSQNGIRKVSLSDKSPNCHSQFHSEYVPELKRMMEERVWKYRFHYIQN